MLAVLAVMISLVGTATPAAAPGTLSILQQHAEKLT